LAVGWRLAPPRLLPPTINLVYSKGKAVAFAQKTPLFVASRASCKKVFYSSIVNWRQETALRLRHRLQAFVRLSEALRSDHSENRNVWAGFLNKLEKTQAIPVLEIKIEENRFWQMPKQCLHRDVWGSRNTHLKPIRFQQEWQEQIQVIIVAYDQHSI